MATTPLRDARVVGVGVLLAVLGRAASERLREALKRSDLRPRQYQALGLLRDDGPRARLGSAGPAPVPPPRVGARTGGPRRRLRRGRGRRQGLLTTPALRRRAPRGTILRTAPGGA